MGPRSGASSSGGHRPPAVGSPLAPPARRVGAGSAESQSTPGASACFSRGTPPTWTPFFLVIYQADVIHENIKSTTRINCIQKLNQINRKNALFFLSKVGSERGPRARLQATKDGFIAQHLALKEIMSKYTKKSPQKMIHR